MYEMYTLLEADNIIQAKTEDVFFRWNKTGYAGTTTKKYWKPQESELRSLFTSDSTKPKDIRWD